MAYRNSVGDLCPNKAGEFCGNGRPLAERLSMGFPNWDETWEVWEQGIRAYYADKRYGKPSCCEMGTSDEMAAKGWVGLYLKEDHALLPGDTPVETDALTEAVSTYLPNQRAMR